MAPSMPTALRSLIALLLCQTLSRSSAHSPPQASRRTGTAQRSALQLAPAVALSSAEARAPRYARLGGNIETLWQPPRGPDVKGVLFLAHGCMHQATDFFSQVGHDGHEFEGCAASNFGACLGLPEERQLVRAARDRGYYVAAVSGGAGKQRCWDFDADPARVKLGLQHIYKEEGLPDHTPLLALGASSGGAFMGPLARALVPERALRCIVPEISALHLPDGAEGFADLKVPTLFVHMAEHDPATALAVEGNIKGLRDKVRVEQISVSPVKPLEEFTAHFPDQAPQINQALQDGGLLQSSGFLSADPRESAWRDAPGLRELFAGGGGHSTDSLKADESPLAEVMNVAWAQHEFTAKFASRILDFCEGKSAQ